MTQTLLYIIAGLIFLSGTWLLLRPSRERTRPAHSPPAVSIEFFPVHCRNFPQLRHALSFEDAPYLASRASPAVYLRWKKGLRRAGRLYLAGLREDFSRLNRQARVLALYSPQVGAKHEAELLRLNFQFQLLEGIVWWNFMLGRPAAVRLEKMAALIGSLGSRLEQAGLAPQISSGAISP